MRTLPPPTKPATHAGLPLYWLLTLVFVGIGLATTWLVRAALEDRQQVVITQWDQMESRRTAEQIYQHLYSAMRKGWSRAELDDTIQRIATSYPDLEIRLVRGAEVAAQYGDDDRSRLDRRDDPAVRSVLGSGRPIHFGDPAQLRYLMPLRNQEECQGCHDAPVGTVNGLIDIRMAPDTLRAPIQATLTPVLNLISLLLVGIFLTVFLLLRHQIVRPIVELSRHIGRLGADLDQAEPIASRRGWPREINHLAGKFNQLLREVQHSHQGLRELAVRDTLTGLYNRRYFDEMFAKTLSQADRNGHPVSLLMLDLDRFKPINDRYGHAMGDAVLAAVGKTLLELTREGDICSRVGGDEFLIIAVDCDPGAAHQLGQRIVESIGTLTWPAGDETVTVQASIGVANYPANARSLEDLIAAADQAMYRNKRTHAARPPA
ncbi:MAG: GGDEF domain-containing protein [Pseudomonadota bacterium]